MILHLRLYAGETPVTETRCLSAVLEREIYTPYSTLTAVFPASQADYGAVSRVGLVWNNHEIFLGLADSVTVFRRSGVRLVRVTSRTFTSLLTQNELEPGLHANLTFGQLVSGFYQFPHVTYEPDSRTNYIFVKDGMSLWDSVSAFGYKITGKIPYTVNNHIRMTPPEDPAVHTLTGAVITETGNVRETAKLISHYHMEDLEGNPNVYQQSNADALAAEIVRHKQIPFDRQFLSQIPDALSYRLRFSMRGWRAEYLEYAGFHNEQPGECMTLANVLQEAVICRVKMTFTERGIRTRLWTYRDQFYGD